MNNIRAGFLRGIVCGLVSGAAAFLVVFFLGKFPAKFHAWTLATFTVLFAISDSHYKSLLSELSALLRRGTYSVWQLEQLNQTVPQLRKRIAFVWTLATWLKALVGLACALLLWDDLPPKSQLIVLFLGYTFLFYSILFAIWGQRNFRKLEREVDALTMKEASLKEKRRLVKELEAGEQHDFKNDNLAQGYTKPPTPI